MPLLLLITCMSGALLGTSSFSLKDASGGIDSLDYLRTAQLWNQPRAFLSSIRSIGYPTFLALTHGPLNFLPLYAWQMLLLFLAFGVFYFVLTRMNFLWWESFLVTLILFLTNLELWRRVGVALSDMMASCLTLATFSLSLLYIKSRVESRWLLATVGTSTFLSYLVRPDRIYLVFLVPFSVFVGYFLTGQWRRQISRVASVAIVTILPFTLFCSLRKALVDHFGLVSFEGMNLSALAAQLLTPEMVPELPPALRPLADRILERRAVLTESFRNPRRFSFRSPVREQEDGIDFELAAFQHNPIFWQAAWPAAIELYTSPEEARFFSLFHNRGNVSVEQYPSVRGSRPNEKLRELSSYVLKQRGAVFISYVRQGMWLVGRQSLPGWGAISLLMLVVINGLKWTVVDDFKVRTETWATISLAFGFWIFHVLTFATFGVPAPRYVMAARMFLSLVPIVLGMECLRAIYSAIKEVSHRINGVAQTADEST